MTTQSKAGENIRIAEDVAAAIEADGGVVALESTVLAHGLPRPRNLEVGMTLEDEVRHGGGVPATVAVLGGVPAVGLTAAELRHLCGTDAIAKLSTRDLPVAVAGGADGATTVAATMALSSRVGVRVFATGGIGGVHRDASADVSADLTELGRTAQIVVCAGPKAILDLPATREGLETRGVVLVGWETDEMPAFYSRESGLAVDVRVTGAGQVAELWHAARRLDLPGAILVCVPPPEENAMPGREVEAHVEGALAEARRQGVSGKAVTPFLLAAMARRSGGDTLEANVALLRRNARVAGEIAAALAGR